VDESNAQTAVEQELPSDGSDGRAIRDWSPSTTSTPLDEPRCVTGVSALGHMSVTQLPMATWQVLT